MALAALKNIGAVMDRNTSLARKNFSKMCIRDRACSLVSTESRCREMRKVQQSLEEKSVGKDRRKLTPGFLEALQFYTSRCV